MFYSINYCTYYTVDGCWLRGERFLQMVCITQNVGNRKSNRLCAAAADGSEKNTAYIVIPLLAFVCFSESQPSTDTHRQCINQIARMQGKQRRACLTLICKLT